VDGDIEEKKTEDSVSVIEAPVLPDVPTLEPGDDGPSPKKAKTDEKEST
jgi:hypothetical protein